MKRILLALSALTLLTGCAGNSGTTAQESFVAGNGQTSYIKVSDRVEAPQLSGMTLLGTKYIAPKGAVTVVNVWASWCSPCRAEEPTLSALAVKYPEVNFVGVLTRDNPVNAEAFVRKHQVPYPTLIDDSVLIKFAKSLPANAIPTTLVIDKNGLVAGRISGVVTIASLSELLDTVEKE
ncbi:MAG: TlpA family protein disulfide reductase [Candidatus Planktophila sp.]